jgi:hypothetical protein
MTELTNGTVIKSGEFAFVSYISINYESEVSKGIYPAVLNQTSIVYSNGGTEVYFKP